MEYFLGAKSKMPTRALRFKLEMKPLRPDIPIYVAALKQKAIEQIGECADGWIPTFWPYERLQDGRKLIEAGVRFVTVDVRWPLTPEVPGGFNLNVPAANAKFQPEHVTDVELAVRIEQIGVDGLAAQRG